MVDHTELTVGQLVRHLAPKQPLRGSAPRWPPDAFAIAAALLQRSGAYTRVFEAWPPAKAGIGWRTKVTKIGIDWRGNAAANREAPSEVQKWWDECRKALQTPLSTLGEHHAVIEALLHLIAASDEACTGIGIPSAELGDLFEFRTLDLLLPNAAHTLCRMVDPSRAIVLPKRRTPPSGLTLRSLTHNLALYLPGEVAPHWRWQPTNLNKDKSPLNLLLLPWPLEPAPQFKEAGYRLDSMPPNLGFFNCDPSSGGSIGVTAVLAAYEAALKRVDDLGGASKNIHGIIFPELSLQADEPAAIAVATGAFVIGGVREVTSNHGGRCRNYSAVVMPPTRDTHRQAKHHRWRLDRSQIDQYKITTIDQHSSWWENIGIERRELTFFAMSDCLTFSVLICEDLARPDPTTELLRSVGPNLVIALLMDGPQLRSRWPSRYATVLADDPGSSVLTLTSLGMALSCVPKRRKPNRTIALWKDAKNGPIEIKLGANAIGVVLSLQRSFVDEWTADGRSDLRANWVLSRKDIHDITPQASALTTAAGAPGSSRSALGESFARDEWRLAIVAYWIQRFRAPATTAIDEVTFDDTFKRMLPQFETLDASAMATCWYQGLDSPASPNAFSEIASEIQRWARDNAISRTRD